ncbi:DUF1616 domain-containing protein [Luteimonas aquatica]|uniref:DUF1616 domain-containing protein n=1 Tax=Luteimonas aquatica TaxID=450364 RepID=UPI001F55C726|nr:DUF1616 domain-containing protein [Luteimonas aquatica]
MNAQVEFNLALILFLPWFLILAVLYWRYPRQPRHAARRIFDLAAIALSVAAFLATIHWAQQIADAGAGRIWRQILATSLGYGAFLAVLALALLLRWRWLRRA